MKTPSAANSSPASLSIWHWRFPAATGVTTAPSHDTCPGSTTHHLPCSRGELGEDQNSQNLQKNADFNCTMFLFLFFTASLSLARNLGHLNWARLLQLQEPQQYPFLPACAVFSLVSREKWIVIHEGKRLCTFSLIQPGTKKCAHKQVISLFCNTLLGQRRSNSTIHEKCTAPAELLLQIVTDT